MTEEGCRLLHSTRQNDGINYFHKHPFVRADFGRYAFEVPGGIERRARAFVHAAAVANVAAFAFQLVAFEKCAKSIARLLVKSGKYVALQVWCILLAGDKSRAGENIPVGRHPDVAVVDVAGILPESFP